MDMEYRKIEAERFDAQPGPYAGGMNLTFSPPDGIRMCKPGNESGPRGDWVIYPVFASISLLLVVRELYWLLVPFVALMLGLLAWKLIGGPRALPAGTFIYPTQGCVVTKDGWTRSTSELGLPLALELEEPSEAETAAMRQAVLPMSQLVFGPGPRFARLMARGPRGSQSLTIGEEDDMQRLRDALERMAQSIEARSK